MANQEEDHLSCIADTRIQLFSDCGFYWNVQRRRRNLWKFTRQLSAITCPGQ